MTLSLNPSESLQPQGWLRYLSFSTDHKVIGIHYIVFTFIMYLVGGLFAEVFRAGYQELAKIQAAQGDKADATDNLTRTLRRATAAQGTQLERYINFLGTTGATAPFIGLFGTVWGILRAFQKLGTAGQATIDVVGPDIAHALIATAVGLAAAIPAVIAFNYFNSSLRVLHTEMDNFSADFLNIVKRHLK
jgi:biopolymer transport protein TolQ